MFGETVFTTSITSYTESLTDPSYQGQLLTFTQPLMGNYGVPNNRTPGPLRSTRRTWMWAASSSRPVCRRPAWW